VSLSEDPITFERFIELAESDRERAKRLLDQHPELLHLRGFMLETPLHYAAVENDCIAVRYFLERGANPNVTNKCGCSPLQETVFLHSANISYLDVIRLLLEAGADPHFRSPSMDRAWEIVQDSEDLDLVRLLRKYSVR
jgi:ankyrin repeat protein